MPASPETTADRPSLVADIGGTNTRVALTEAAGVREGSIRRYSNADHDGLESVLRKYREEEGTEDCAAACVAVAGPVRDGVAEMTNLDWTIDLDLLTRATGATRTAILNDLQAQGHAIGHLAADALHEVIPRRGDPAPDHATKLVIGIGTGFNAAPVFETPRGRYVAASESGHVNLPLGAETDLRLAQQLRDDHGFAGVEEVLSGRGLEHLYAFHAREAGEAEKKSAAEVMKALEDEGDAIARASVKAFVRLFGAVTGNLALTFLPFGGIYLAGGVARAFGPHLTRFGYQEAICDKGRFSDFLADFPVSVIEDDYAALTGCAAFLHKQLA